MTISNATARIRSLVDDLKRECALMKLSELADLAHRCTEMQTTATGTELMAVRTVYTVAQAELEERKTR